MKQFAFSVLVAIFVGNSALAEECFYETYVRLMAEKLEVTERVVVENLPESRKENMRTTGKTFRQAVRLHGSGYVLSEISKQYDDPTDIAVMSFCVAVFER